MARSSTEKPKGYAWRSSRIFIMTVISMAMFTDQFLFSFIIPVLPVILRDRLQLNSSHTQFLTSVVLSLNALVSIAIAPITGYLADKVQWKNSLMLWSCAVNAVGTALTAWSTTLATLIVGRLLQTLAGSMIWIVGMAILGSSVGSRRLASAFSFCTLFVSAGALSGPALSGALFEFASYSATWSSAFLVIFAGGILQALLIDPSTIRPDGGSSPDGSDTNSDTLNDSPDSSQGTDTDSLLSPPGTPRIPDNGYDSISKIPRRTPSPATSSIGIYWLMLSKRRVATALVADVLFAVIIASFEATIPLHVRDIFHWESLQAGILFLLLQAPALSLVIPAGWLKDRIGMRLPATVGFLLMGPCLWLLGVPGNFSFKWASDRHTGKAIYITTLVGIGICRTLLLGFGGVEVLRGANELTAEIPGVFGAGDGYSRAFAMSNVSWKLGMFLGPLLSGLLTDSVGYYMMNVVLEVIALAGGTGDLGRYLQEELTTDGRYAVALLTRKARRPSTKPFTKVYETDYTESSLLSILDSTRATALVSVIRADDIYLPLHICLLNACLKSTTCNRFIPSEWAGNIEDFPTLPRPYGETRGPLREILYKIPREKLTWTLFNFGWFMDYFLPEEKSYMKYLPGEFPIDPVTGTYCVRGTGEELQSWTCRPFKRVHRSLEQIAASVEDYKSGVQTHTGFVAEIEEWTVSGATACPREKTLKQREKFFSGMHFLVVEELLRKAEAEGRI
ncbi:hypothetical protein BDV06DRAFT_216375 [Aspergillus oleicola]